MSKFEDKVDKILRTFIFKSGGKIQSEALTQSQKAPVMSQDHDPLMDPVVQDDRDVSERIRSVRCWWQNPTCNGCSRGSSSWAS